MRRRHEEVGELLLLEDAALDDLEGLDDGALLPQLFGVGGHGAGKDATDIGVVTSGGGPEDDLAALGVEDGGDDCEVGQMGAAADWCVGEDDVSWLEVVAPVVDLPFHSKGHTSDLRPC